MPKNLLYHLATVVACIFVVVLTDAWYVYLSIYSTYVVSELAQSLINCIAEGFDMESEYLMQLAKVPKDTFLS